MTTRREPGPVDPEVTFLEGWDELCARSPHLSPARILLAAAVVVLDRLEVSGPVLVGGDASAGTRAVEYLRTAGADADWTALLDQVGPGGAGLGVSAFGTETDERPVLSVDGALGTAADVHVDLTASGIAVRHGDGPDARALAGRLLERLRVLVVRLAAAPDGPLLGRTEILTESDRVVNGGTPARLPDYPAVPLHELFRLQAWRTPEAPALVGDGARLTYRELDHVSTVLAHEVVAGGVRPGDAVGVCTERSFELFVAILAILKAGAAFVHLDPDLPVPRLLQFVEVSSPRLVLSGPGAADLGAAVRTAPLPSLAALRAAAETAPPDVVVGVGDPAYVLFTSGSTGIPKAVVRSHLLHTSRVFLEQSLYGLGARDRHLLKLPVSSRELFWPLATGGACVVVPPRGDRDDRVLLQSLRDHEVTVLSIVPSMLRLLAASPAFAELPALRHVFVGGEALHTDLEERVRSLGYEVHTTFTLTEADYVTHRGGPAGELGSDGTNIGRPLDMRVYVCDEHGRRVPTGVIGEVWAGGPGIADGYLGDPERTAQRFVPNPFGDAQAPTLFRTGDLARVHDDGSFEYVGRRDLQVKVRGQRVEPTEVEHWIRAHPAVEDAAVVGYADREQGAVLVAFVVAQDDRATERALRAHLAQHVQSWMIPRHVTFVARLPQLPSGKVDRVALRLPERARPATLPSPTPAQDTVQSVLLDLWRRVLQLDEIGIDDDFFELGGDSLRVMLLRAAIQDELGLSVEAVALLGAPTVRSQAAVLDAPRDGGAGAAPAAPVAPRRATVAPQRPDRSTTAVEAERERRAALLRSRGERGGVR